MFSVSWHLSATMHRYMAIYAPSNILINRLRFRRGWRSPLVALTIAAAYFAVIGMCAIIIDNGGPGVLNLLVLLCFWNAGKLGWFALTAPFLLLRNRSRAPHDRFQIGTDNDSAGLAAMVRA